jgi:hypothetical protein
MHPDYSFALEKKKTWIEFGIRDLPKFYNNQDDPMLVRAFIMYETILQISDTYVMNQRFCQLVDNARLTVPETLEFRPEWVNSKCGWMWLMEPFAVPNLVSDDAYKRFKKPLRVSAIGWVMLRDKELDNINEARRKDPKLGKHLNYGATQVCCYFDYGTGVEGPCGISSGFGMWSHFILNPGDSLQSRVLQYENHYSTEFTSEDEEGLRYLREDQTLVLHEVRWAFTAFYLMHQKLATIVPQQACRGTRKRFERDKTPILPEYRIITLRRMEEARKKEAHKEANPVEWQWQWNVSGHWRSQWYPVEQEYRDIFIEDYVKGPVDKPFKPVTEKIYRAVR